jgi:hypothetical protein
MSASREWSRLARSRSNPEVCPRLENAGTHPGEPVATVVDRPLALLTPATTGAVILFFGKRRTRSQHERHGQNQRKCSFEQSHDAVLSLLICHVST